jgi:transcriptional regulator GlxA family with amidase domain
MIDEHKVHPSAPGRYGHRTAAVDAAVDAMRRLIDGELKIRRLAERPFVGDSIPS